MVAMLFSYILIQTKETKKSSKLPHNSKLQCWCTKVQYFTPTHLENFLDSYFHWTTEHTWWTNISSLLSSLGRKAKQTKIRTFAWENQKMQISSVSPSRVKTKFNFAMLSSSARRTEHVFQRQINGDKLNECVRKTQSTKGQTKEDEKVETDLN